MNENSMQRLLTQLTTGNHQTLLSEMLTDHCALGNLEAATFLLNAGAHINVKDRNGNTPLHYALHRNHLPIVRLLLDRGADMHAVDNKGNMALHHAAKTGSKEAVALLIDRGAWPNFANNRGITPEVYAKMKGHEHLVLMLQHSAPPCRWQSPKRPNGQMLG